MNPRARARLVVAAVAGAAAAIAVGAAIVQGRADHDPGEPPPLELNAASPALRAAEAAFERGDRRGARARFEALLERDPSSLEAAVGLAVASWPDGTVERLRGLSEEHPGSGLVRLHLGLALFAQGEREEAEREWTEAERRDPDTPAAIRAEDLLHPDMAPGRPYFYPASFPELAPGLSADEQLEELRARGDWLSYGVALQRAGRPVSALRAYERALAAEPDSLEARVAVAVARFDKDEPAQAFSRLGPLTGEHPEAEIVRYHLGLVLLWIRALDEAEEQLSRASRGNGSYARLSQDLLARVEEISTRNT